MFINLQKMQCDVSKVYSNTNLSAELEKIASDKGYVISDNEGSGNCMFHALSEQLNLAKGIRISHGELRQSIVQYLRKNPTLVSSEFYFVRIRKHCQRIRNNHSSLESVFNGLKYVTHFQCIFQRIFNAFSSNLLCRVFANRKIIFQLIRLEHFCQHLKWTCSLTKWEKTGHRHVPVEITCSCL